MKKNVVFMLAVKVPQYPWRSEPYKYGIASWKKWCEKNNCELFVLEDLIHDNDYMKINWQRYYVFDLLEQQGIEYDQIALVDSSFMIKWDAPNFFEMTDRRFTAWRDMDNMRWIYDSIQGYEDLFQEANDMPHFKLDQSKYVNSGFMVFNEEHKDLFTSFKEFYYDYIDIFIDLQDNKVKKGTEQTPMNYWLQLNKIDVNLDLPLPFKLTHLQRKELFSHNWQLQEDQTPFFLKYGYNFSFNGIPKEDRTNVMKQTWNFIKDNYDYDNIKFDKILDTMPHKDTAKYTTSRKFKNDILKFFSDEKFKDLTMIELGSCQGNSTFVYSNVFKKVYGVEKDGWNIEQSTNRCKDRDNVEFIQKDIYTEEWDFPQADVVMIDAGHTYQHIIHDVEKAVNYFNNPIIILDDYGNPKTDIKKAIDELIDNQVLSLHTHIGEESGFKTAAGWVMNDREGGIFNI